MGLGSGNDLYHAREAKEFFKPFAGKYSMKFICVDRRIVLQEFGEHLLKTGFYGNVIYQLI